MLWQKTKANPSFRPHHSLLEINQPYYPKKCEEIGSEKPTQRACKLNHSFSPFIPNNLCIKVGPKIRLTHFYRFHYLRHLYCVSTIISGLHTS